MRLTFGITVTQISLRTGLSQCAGTALRGRSISRTKTEHPGAIVHIIVPKVRVKWALYTFILNSLSTNNYLIYNHPLIRKSIVYTYWSNTPVYCHIDFVCQSTTNISFPLCKMKKFLPLLTRLITVLPFEEKCLIIAWREFTLSKRLPE